MLFAQYYIEGDAWQYLWFVPHDPEGLVSLFPSREAYIAKLDKFFNLSTYWPTTALPDPWCTRCCSFIQCICRCCYLCADWAGNEPDIFAPFQFVFGGRQDLTAKWSRFMLNTQYSTKPDGIPGNDDYGTMSAWVLFAMLGFYPQAGTPRYVVGSPVFPNVVIRRRAGDIRVVAHDASAANIYVQKAAINGIRRVFRCDSHVVDVLHCIAGKPLTTGLVLHDDLSLGPGRESLFELWMGPKPSSPLWAQDTELQSEMS